MSDQWIPYGARAVTSVCFMFPTPGPRREIIRNYIGDMCLPSYGHIWSYSWSVGCISQINCTACVRYVSLLWPYELELERREHVDCCQWYKFGINLNTANTVYAAHETLSFYRYSIGVHDSLFGHVCVVCCFFFNKLNMVSCKFCKSWDGSKQSWKYS